MKREATRKGEKKITWWWAAGIRNWTGLCHQRLFSKRRAQQRCRVAYSPGTMSQSAEPDCGLYFSFIQLLLLRPRIWAKSLRGGLQLDVKAVISAVRLTEISLHYLLCAWRCSECNYYIQLYYIITENQISTLFATKWNMFCVRYQNIWSIHILCSLIRQFQV